MKKFCAWLGLPVVLATPWAYAQENPTPQENPTSQENRSPWDPWEKFSFSLGGFAASLSNEARIGLPGAGVVINIEDALGLDASETVFRIDTSYRFGDSRRHRVDFTWFDLSRKATRTLTDDILVDGTTYPAGATVNSEFDLAFYNLRYSYSFIHDDRVDFAGSVGLHVTDLGLKLNSATQGAAGDTVTAPLPVIGGRLDVVLTPRWYARSSVEFLYVALNDFKGSITDSLMALEYRPWQHLSFGAGLNVVRFRLQADSSDAPVNFRGKIDSNFAGLLLYAKALF
jgi:hypothetical protein